MNEIFHAEEDTSKGEEVDLLAHVLEKYEEGNYPIDAPNTTEPIRFMKEQIGFDDNDL